MIQVEINEKPDLKKCEMKCDNELHKKLNKYELTKFLNKHGTHLFLGKMGSGKSSFLWNLFKCGLLKKVWQNIFIFRPKLSGNSIKDDIFAKLPKEQIFDELTYENLSYVKDRIMEASEEGENSCIIFDDMAAYLKSNETLTLFKELIFNRRHMHCTMFFLVQTWKSVERSLRNLFSTIFIFQIAKDQFQDLFGETLEFDKKYLQPILDFVYDKPHNFLFVDMDSKTLFKNWDKIHLID